MARLIVPSMHGNSAGIIGALFLAHDALKKNITPKKLYSRDGALSISTGFLAGLAAGLLVAFVFTRSRS